MTLMRRDLEYIMKISGCRKFSHITSLHSKFQMVNLDQKLKSSFMVSDVTHKTSPNKRIITPLNETRKRRVNWYHKKNNSFGGENPRIYLSLDMKFSGVLDGRNTGDH